MTIHRGSARIAVAVAGVALLGAALSGLGANAVQARPDRGAQPVDRKHAVVTDTATATVSCEFQQVADLVALSGGPGSSVRARGWWHHGNCPVSRAEVNVRLQARHDGDWHDIGPAAIETLRPGDRTQATFRCHNTRPTKWRSVIDVDLIDHSDDPERLTTPVRVLSCCPDPSDLR